LILLIIVALAFFPSCTKVKKEYWTNGQIKSEVHMKGDNYQGKAVYYFESGGIQLECFYKDNLLQGPFIRYWAFNKKKDEQNYEKGNLDGLSTTWYEDGGKETEATYMNGILNGPYHEYHPDNHIRVDGQYLNGFFSGRWLYYDFSGDIIGESQFTHGTGRERAFYSNGNLKHEINFKDNLRDGEEIIYNENKTVRTIYIFSHDTLIRSMQK
jgi:antitoxin component YwqK of YwqJK toxin-antitoxin module